MSYKREIERLPIVANQYQIRPSSILRINARMESQTRSKKTLLQFEQMRENVNYQTNDISKHARKRLMRALETITFVTPTRYIYNAQYNKKVKFKLATVTLTLSFMQEKITDKLIVKHLLTPFLAQLKRQYGVINYVWKAEKQKNKNIHFHIIIDNYIDHLILRNIWNSYQKRHGLLKSYYDNYGHYNPNSTDIHAVSNSTTLQKYLVKYLGKHDKENLVLDCKNWDATLLLKQFNYTLLDFNMIDEKILNDIIKQYSKDSINSEHFDMYFFEPQTLMNLLPKQIKSEFLYQYEKQGLLRSSQATIKALQMFHSR